MSLPRRTGTLAHTRRQSSQVTSEKNSILIYQTFISVLLILAGVFVNKVNLSVMKPAKDMVSSVLTENYGLTAVSAAVQKFAQSAGLDDLGVFKLFEEKTAGENTDIEPIPSESTGTDDTQGTPAAETSTVPTGEENKDNTGGGDITDTDGEDSGEKYIIAANKESAGIGGTLPQSLQYEVAGTPQIPANALDEKKSLGVELTKPVNGQVSSVFGFRKHPTTGETTFHYGTDYAAPKGTPIKASANGTVEETGVSNIFGRYVLIKHKEGVYTFYGHCDKVEVKRGNKVKAGKVIALVGSTGISTGPHLHFEIRYNDKYINPEKNIT